MHESTAHPNWENATPEELRVTLEAAPTRRRYLRLNAIRLFLLGYTRAQVCEITNRSNRKVRLWIEQFNRGGMDAPVPRKSTVRPRKVKLERVRDLLMPVLENPAPAGVVQGTALRWLHDLNFKRRRAAVQPLPSPSLPALNLARSR